MLMETAKSQENVLDLSSRSSLSPPQRKLSSPSYYKADSSTPSVSSDEPQLATISPHTNSSRLNLFTEDSKAFQDTLPQFPGMPIPMSNQSAFPPSFDPLSLAATAAAYQSANPLNGISNLNLMPVDAGSMSSYATSQWSLYLNHLSSRKRKASSMASTLSDGESSSKQQKQTDGRKRSGEEKQDNSYWDRRRKNNEAAKRSRDARRQKEEEIALRAAFLEQENLKLRAQVTILKNESAKLHFLLYNRSNNTHQSATSPSS